MNKKQITVSVFMTMLFILLVISISFAWYKADIDNKAIDLASAGITLTLEDESGSMLTPDVLKEGVLNDSQTLPSDYEANKSKYTESGTTVTIKENVDIYIEEGTSVSLTVKLGS